MKQSKALAILKSGRNAFLTGSAGSGKTFVLNQYIRYLKTHGIAVAVTASTGIAATHLNGQTIHSWSGIGICDEITSSHLSSLGERKYFRDKMDKVKVLIIDEISMVHKNTLELVDKVLRHFKHGNAAFGGVQIVFAGDFFQLPPIGTDDEMSRDKFAFMSQAWLDAAPTICYLTEQHRQSDNSLNTILNEIRTGDVSQSSIDLLNSRASDVNQEEFEETMLFTHNAAVDRINKHCLARLEEESKFFKAEQKGNEALLEGLKRSVLASEKLELKVGARVIFTKNNFEKGYVNGTLGIVNGFSENDLPIIRTRDNVDIEAEPETWAIENEVGRVLASFTQIPVQLAWAITVHKSQGMTLDAAVIDLSRAFESGQGYVALSRLRDLERMTLNGFNQTALLVDELATKADVRFCELSRESDETLDESALESSFKTFIHQCDGITDRKGLAKLKENLSRKGKREKGGTYKITFEYVAQKMSIAEIAEKRGLTTGTILSHFTRIADMFPETDFEIYRPAAEMIERVRLVAAKLGQEEMSLGRIFAALNEEVSYDDIKLSMLFINDRPPAN